MEQAPHRCEVEIAVSGRELDDVGDPPAVRSVGTEVPLEQPTFVASGGMNGAAGDAMPATL